jgi:hypothetical protein
MQAPWLCSCFSLVPKVLVPKVLVPKVLVPKLRLGNAPPEAPLPDRKAKLTLSRALAARKAELSADAFPSRSLGTRSSGTRGARQRQSLAAG